MKHICYKMQQMLSGVRVVVSFCCNALKFVFLHLLGFKFFLCEDMTVSPSLNNTNSSMNGSYCQTTNSSNMFYLPVSCKKNLSHAFCPQISVISFSEKKTKKNMWTE